MTPPMEQPASVDYAAEGAAVDMKLLRALALGARRSGEIQLLLDSQAGGSADYQALALALADYSAPEAKAAATFEAVRRHQARLSARLDRVIGIKAAALDYYENLELALGIHEDSTLTYAQLEQMAFRDHLTGLPNYRFYSQRFAEELKRAGRYRHLVSLLMIDIDRFKAFNDTFGHPAGNQALEHLAGILAEEVRDTDLAARYGGEEFAVLLPETTKREALALAERLRARMEASPVLLEEGGPQRLTISLGVACFPRDARDAEALLAGADDALYRAKEGGRNRVVTFEPPSHVDLRFWPTNPQTVSGVSVVGEFNDWETDADPMQPQGDGSFGLRLALAPGRYEYKFVVNGDWYMADPACHDAVHDGYGGRNSVMTVAGGAA